MYLDYGYRSPYKDWEQKLRNWETEAKSKLQIAILALCAVLFPNSVIQKCVTNLARNNTYVRYKPNLLFAFFVLLIIITIMTLWS